MTAGELPHVDLVAYLMDDLDQSERVQVEGHLSGCASCAAELTELRPAGRLLALAAPPAPAPSDLEQRTLAAVASAAAAANGRVDAARVPEPERRPVARPGRRRLPWRPLAFAGGLAALLAAAVFAGSQLGGDDLPGSLELEATLTAPSGQTAQATVREVGIGRVIDFRTDALPILPKGEFYELWFVGPGDRPGRPNRISAGTFHPDQDGRSNVRFTAAVDPSVYPRLAVTAEPGDGDPAPSGADIMRSSQP